MNRYRLYIDESGDHTYYSLDVPAKRFLGLTGICVDNEYYRTVFQPELERLKQKHFPHSPDEPVIFHREHIINRKGSFWRLRDADKEKGFNEDLLQFLRQQSYVIITVVIDKKTHVERYGSDAYHPYHYCLTALLERYCGFLHFNNAHGDVMAENRGKTEDMKLKSAYKRIYESGTQFRDFSFFRNVLTSLEIKLKPKFANIAGLQIADLIAHPSKQQILFENKMINRAADNFGDQVCEQIESKYNRQVYEGKVCGYGKIFLG